MFKRVLIALLLLVILATGLGYAIYQDPERRERILFEQLISSLALQITPIENQFRQRNSLVETQFDLALEYSDSQSQPQIIQADVTVSTSRLTVNFGEGDTELSNKTVIFEPLMHTDQVLWKCINGTVLVRYRPRPCRLGEGITFNRE